MRAAGDVVHADIFTESQSGRSKGCGIVSYRSWDDAQRAVEELNNTELLGRKIFVREDREASTTGAASRACRVYVGNLAWHVTWQDLKDHFKTIGEVLRADVMCEGNVEGGRSKGYGIVELRTTEEAQAAINQLTDTELRGRKIFVREDKKNVRVLPQTAPGPFAWGFGTTPDIPDYWGYQGGSYGGKAGIGDAGDGQFTKVFVGNLAWQVTWQDLKDHMRTVGDVVRAEIMTEGGVPNGRSKGCATVEFATFGAARRAVQRLHDSMLLGRPILVREFRE